MYVSLCGCFIWIFYRLLKKTEGRCVPLEYESCSPEHHFTFEATPKNVFLASVQSYSALCTRWLYLLNCALKANARPTLTWIANSPTHWQCLLESRANVVLSVNATHCHNCAAAKNETLSKDSASLGFKLAQLHPRLRTRDLVYYASNKYSSPASALLNCGIKCKNIGLRVAQWSSGL